MIPRKRFDLTVNHEEPDRVPVDVWFTPEMRDRLATHLGLRNPLRPAGEPNSLALTLPQDLLITTVGPCESFYLSNKDYYVDEWGIGWRRVEYQGGSYTEPVDHPLASLDDPDKFTLPNFEKGERYKKAEYLVKHYGNEYPIVGEIACSIFELSWYLRGLKRVLIDLKRNKSFMHDFIDKLKRWAKVAGRKLTETGIDVIFLGDDLGMQNQMLISPDIFREFFKPIYAELFEEFKQMNPNIKIAFHTDGNIKPILDDFVEIGLDILNPVQPQSMAPQEIGDKYGEKLVLWGTLDNQDTIPFGSPEEVENEVCSRLKNIAPNGGLILGPAHNVQPNTPLENLEVMYKAIQEYGYYPINI